VKRLDVSLVPGTGIANGLDPIQTTPTMALSWSLDGGYAEGVPLLREIGAQARTKNRISVHRLGLMEPQGMRLTMEVADPVYAGIFGVDVDVEQRMK
jgi:hypothetical protein